MISEKKPENRGCKEQHTVGARRACTSDLPDAEIRLSSVTISEKIHPEGFTPSAQPAEQVPSTRRHLGPPYLRVLRRGFHPICGRCRLAPAQRFSEFLNKV